MKVLVLGGASAIAEAFCRLLAPGGASFFLTGRDVRQLEAVAADLRVRGAGPVHVLADDLNNVNEHNHILDSAWQALAGIDTALLAYGILGDQQKAETDFAEAQRVLYTNFISAASWILRIAERFAAQGSGKLAVIGSVAGDRGRKSNFVYGTSKGAISLLMEGLRHRHYGSGLCLLTVKPGMVATPMTAHMPRTPLFATPEAVAKEIVAGLEKNRSTIYAPGFWRIIMGIIRHLPEFIFNRSNL
jgi:short-subunit dehydrogenase